MTGEYRVHVVISEDGALIQFIDKEGEALSDQAILLKKFGLKNRPRIDLDEASALSTQNMYRLPSCHVDIQVNNGTFVEVLLPEEEVTTKLLPSRVKARLEDVCNQIETYIKNIETLDMILPLEV